MDPKENPPVNDDDGAEMQEKKIPLYLAMLEHPEPGSRWKAAGSLARQGDNRAVGFLVQALSDEDWRARQKTAWGAPGYLGDPVVIPGIQMCIRR